MWFINLPSGYILTLRDYYLVLSLYKIGAYLTELIIATASVIGYCTSICKRYVCQNNILYTIVYISVS